MRNLLIKFISPVPLNTSIILIKFKEVKMENSNNLSLPYIAPAQAQKHVTHNEAIRMLDTIVMLSVKSQILGTPPNTPMEGDRYIIADSPQGIWVDNGGNIVTWVDNTWAFTVPQEGWLCSNEADKKLIVLSNNNWKDAESLPTQIDNISAIGINTTIDQNNRLSISADSTLLSHEGAGHRLALNKYSISDTASLIFQTNYSGKAEFGLIGSDDFSIKVSPDGSNFIEAISIDKTSAEVKLPSSARVILGDYKGPTDIYDKLYIGGDNPGIRMEMSREWGGFAADLFNLKVHKASTGENFNGAKIGFVGGLNDDSEILGDIDVINYIYFGVGKDSSYYNNGLRIYSNNNVWCTADLSAASFTDRTPYPKTLQLAYDCVNSMQRLPEGEYNEKDKDLQLDHKILHPYLATTYEDVEKFTLDRKMDNNENIKAHTTITKTARDLSATVSVQNEVIKDLIQRISALEKQSTY